MIHNVTRWSLKSPCLTLAASDLLSLTSLSTVFANLNKERQWPSLRWNLNYWNGGISYKSWSQHGQENSDHERLEMNGVGNDDHV